MGLLFSKPKPAWPATVPTDTIIPGHYWDSQPIMRAYCIDLTFRFDDVLDTDKMRAALARLLEIGDWRKLGARIRLNEAGKLEYHVPEKYDEKRPGFVFTTAKYDMSINDHPLASRLPKMSQMTTDRPSLLGSTAEFGPLVRSQDEPKKLEDWLYSDLPQLPIHVVSFDDATLVTVTFMHTLTDAMGMSSFLRAWTAVLRGQEDQVPLFIGFNKDPMASLGEATPPERYVYSKKLLKGLSMVMFVVRFVFDLLWHRQEDERVIFVPARYLQQMRDSALQELAAESNEERNHFVSEGDVLYSWLSRIILSALKPAADRTIALLNVFDVRSTLGEDRFPRNSAYIGNAVISAFAFVPARRILEGPLSFIASQLRAALEQQRTREQIQSYAAIHTRAVEKTGQVPLFGDGGMLLLSCTNWAKGRLFEIDFSSAVIAPGVPLSQRANKLGRASYINVAAHKNGIPTRNTVSVVGKDTAGNFWTIMSMRKEAWPRIEEYLKALSRK